MIFCSHCTSKCTDHQQQMTLLSSKYTEICLWWTESKLNLRSGDKGQILHKLLTSTVTDCTETRHYTHTHARTHARTHTHTHTRLTALYRPDALPAAQPTASKHWRDKTRHYIPVKLLRTHNICFSYYFTNNLVSSTAIFQVNLDKAVTNSLSQLQPCANEQHFCH